MLKRISLIRFIVAFSVCLPVSRSCFCPIEFPNQMADRIILNPSENPATSLSVSWRTDTTVHLGYCELQLATVSRINPTDSKQFKAKTVSMVFTNDAEPTIYSNHHTFTFTGLTPEQKYIYRVGEGDHWSEWFQFKTHTINDQSYSFLYFGDPQVSLRSECARVIRKASMDNPFILLPFKNLFF